MKGKRIKDVFADIEVPDALSEARISSLKVDIPRRTMKIVLRLEGAVGQRALNEFRSLLTDYYTLSDLDFKVLYDITFTQRFLDVYKDCVIDAVCRENAAVKYLFADSLWELSGDKIKITLLHDCMNLVTEQDIGAKIERVIKNETGYIVAVSFVCDPIESPEPILPPPPAPDTKKEEDPDQPKAICGKIITGEPVPTPSVSIGDFAVVEGRIFEVDSRAISRGRTLFTFFLADSHGAIACKLFIDDKSLSEVKPHMKNGTYLRVRGKAQTDDNTNEITIIARDINTTKEPIPPEDAPVKRVELHLHTQISAMDGVTSAENFVKRAIAWGHKAIAITDHGVVQAFPEAYKTKTKAKSDIKIIYGTECYLVNDFEPIAFNVPDMPLDGEMVVFDIETTGLSAKHDAITEIGAVKIKGGRVIDRFSSFVNPMRPIPEKITRLTGITNKMVENAPPIKTVLADFLAFCGGAPLVAHNATFDISFIRHAAKNTGIPFNNGHIDTLPLCRALFPDLKRHRLDVVAKHLGISNTNHHRAVNDAEVAAQILFACLEILNDKNITRTAEINSLNANQANCRFVRPNHAVLLAKNATGLRNLYMLISKSHLDFFSKTPRIPKSVLMKYREGLLIGSGCKEGEVYSAIVSGEDEANIEALAAFYDYLEIQPVANSLSLLEEGLVKDENELRDINRRILNLGDKLGKIVVATGDAHFLNPSDEIYRRVLITCDGAMEAGHSAPLYFRSTADMLNEFSYLGEDDAYRVVVENTNLIADEIEDLRPVPKGSFPPEIEGSDSEIKRLATERAKEIYGDPLPQIVSERMEKELKSIIDNGFAVMYLIAHLLVKKSLEDGYMVGSRGSVGSSFVAFLTGITEVNSLVPHYVCPACRHSEFVLDGSYGSGFDMPDKPCPACGTSLKKDGHNIPFETFLGFDGDKAPDIDLNFSGDYQTTAHRYAEEIFGDGYTFRAGTINTVAKKTAYGYVKKYCEINNLTLSRAEQERLVEGCTGVKRTTGQHPGGIIVLPKGHDIHEFTPVQYPADDKESNVITTHFDFHSIDENLLKLDLLGHDNPTIIKMLETFTGVNAAEIPLDEEKTMSLFTSCEALGVTEKQIGSSTGTYGVPEFGTKFVRQMLVDTKPNTFSDLVRISGLSHGENVWVDNAQSLIRAGTCTLSECICTRDDIMTYLLQKGLPAKTAFVIMESVRKGNGLKPEWEAEMRANNVPEWYIDSCKKIKYMFPKAHAVAYVTMGFRIAYFKVYYPLAFYRAYFSIRVDDFDYTTMACGAEDVKAQIKALEAQGNRLTQKEKDTLTLLEVCLEMYERGFSFLPVDLYRSDARLFLEADGKILPPLQSLPGLGRTAAESIVSARKKGEFFSLDDLRQRTKVSKTVIEVLRQSGCLEDLPESNQVSLF